MVSSHVSRLCAPRLAGLNQLITVIRSCIREREILLCLAAFIRQQGWRSLDSFNSSSPLTLQLLLIPVLLLLLAILQPRAIMTLQHAMLAAKVPAAESAVSYDSLRGVFAVFETAADFLGAAAPEWEGHVEGAFAGDVVGCQSGGGLGEVLSGED